MMIAVLQNCVVEFEQKSKTPLFSWWTNLYVRVCCAREPFYRTLCHVLHSDGHTMSMLQPLFCNRFGRLGEGSQHGQGKVFDSTNMDWFPFLFHTAHLEAEPEKLSAIRPLHDEATVSCRHDKHLPYFVWIIFNHLHVYNRMIIYFYQLPLPFQICL